MRAPVRSVLLAGLLAVGAVLAAGPPPDSAGQVDLQRYQGIWYELARLPMFFQRQCVASEARYRLLESGRVEVINRCRTAQGDWKQVRGEAQLQQPERTDRLWVRFDNWFSRLLPSLTRSEYWVLYLDPDYRVALVGHPNREYLWLLSRTPQVSEEVQRKLLEEAEVRGYDTSALIWREQRN